MCAARTSGSGGKLTTEDKLRYRRNAAVCCKVIGEAVDSIYEMLGANGIVGAGAPIAVGAAFTNSYTQNGNVAVAFFGDGATNIGAFHEAANMACALHLPIDKPIPLTELRALIKAKTSL